MLGEKSYWSRQMKRRGFLGTAAMGAGSAAFLAACGGGDDDTPSSQATTAPGTSGSPAAGAATSTAPKAVKGGIANALNAADATTFDPVRNQDVYGGLMLSSVADALLQVDKDVNIVGRLVEKFESPQPDQYVLTMRKGIKFHDGTDLNAEAVKFNLQRHIDDAKSVRNADVRDVTLIETPDASTVKITLKAPFAPFLSKLTGGAGYVLSPTAVQKLGEGLQRDMTGAGSGPFKFVEWKKDTQMVVERNDGYWLKDSDGSALPYVDRIVYKVFPDENVRLTNLKTGEGDFMTDAPPYKDIADLRKDTNIVLRDLPGFGFSFAMMNTEKEPFNTPAARRAFSYAIDRDQIRKTVFFENGKVLDAPIPETVAWAYDKDNRPYIKQDLAKAKQELTAAGKPNGFKFTLQIQSNSPQILQTAELMKDQVKAVGLDIEIQLVEFGALVANGNAGNYQAGLIGWTGGIDPDGNYYSLWHSGGGFNLAKYKNPQFDKLLEDGRTTLEQAKRSTIYKQALKIWLEDQPFLIYFNPPDFRTFRKNMQNYPLTYNGRAGAGEFDRMWKQK